MSLPRDAHVVYIPQADRRLGRQVVHDPRSRSFPVAAAAGDLPPLPDRSFRHRVYGPRPVPAQRIGCCTGVDQVVKANTRGNRVRGEILDMADAVRVYELATQYDPFPGVYPPTDTGSSAVAACRAARDLGLIAEYRWLFGDDDETLRTLVGTPVGVGTMWTWGMFDPDPVTGLIEPTGGDAGGHEFTLFGWYEPLDAYELLCWWGTWGLGGRGIARIRRRHLHELVLNDGDRHITLRAGRNG